jgi:hypothetical protein
MRLIVARCSVEYSGRLSARSTPRRDGVSTSTNCRFAGHSAADAPSGGARSHLPCTATGPHRNGDGPIVVVTARLSSLPLSPLATTRKTPRSERGVVAEPPDVPERCALAASPVKWDAGQVDQQGEPVESAGKRLARARARAATARAKSALAHDRAAQVERDATRFYESRGDGARAALHREAADCHRRAAAADRS